MTRTYRTARVLFGAAVAMGAAGGTAGPALAGPAPATGRILQEGAPGSVANSYIVVLRTASGAEVAGAAGALAKTYGGAVRRSYTSAVKGFHVSMTPAAAKRLAANSAVAYVEQDRVVTLDATTQTAPTWGLDRIDQQALPLSRSYTYGSAANVTAYILDSGVRVTHRDFEGRARSGYDFIDSDGDATDCNGHGTHVAGTVGGRTYGVAKDVKLVGVRVLDCAGSGSYSQIIAGVDWVTRNAVQPAVANMSLGGPGSAALDDAVRRSIAAGITYAVAAGNDNVDACQQSPARAAAAITVGATDSADARASFSNYGTCLDVFAPGVRIVAPGKADDTAAATMSGTSMAAPHVAGAAALVLGTYPARTPAQVREALVGGAVTGAVTGAGAGSANRLLYTGAIAPAPAPVTATPTATPSPTPTATPTATAPAATPTTAPTTTAPTTTAPSTAPTTTAPTTTAPTSAPTATPTPCGPFTTKTLVAITDLATASSTRTVSGCVGDASAASALTVDITHSARGQLAVALVAPDGAVYRLKEESIGDTTDHLKATYRFDASGSPRNGTWKLRITDTYKGNIGWLNSWTLTL